MVKCMQFSDRLKKIEQFLRYSVPTWKLVQMYLVSHKLYFHSNYSSIWHLVAVSRIFNTKNIQKWTYTSYTVSMSPKSYEAWKFNTDGFKPHYLNLTRFSWRKTSFWGHSVPNHPIRRKFPRLPSLVLIKLSHVICVSM